MAKSKIEWTEDTWNPTTGCTKISDGCKHCYAKRMTKRLQAMGVDKYMLGFNKIVTHLDTLKTPYSWKKPRMVFVNSMSDLFHKDIPVSFIKDVFSVMNDCSSHTFQVLTKRPERLAEISNQLNWTPNIWMGVTIENNATLNRANYLRITDAKVKFLSIEPLLEKLHNLDLNYIDWVIVGGESGPGARLLKPDWVTSIRDLCESSSTSFFFKQWGGVNKKKNGRLLDNRQWSEMPNLAYC
jgi:protein gp37